MPELGRPPIDARRYHRQIRAKLPVPVALNDLSRQGIGLQPEFFANSRLHPWIEMRMGTNSAAQFADSNLLASSTEPIFTPAELVVHQSHLQTESDRFGMNAVAPPNHRSVLVLPSLLANHIPQFGDIFQQEVTRPNKLYRKRGIQYIRRGKTLMHPSRLRSNVGGDIFKECNQVVIGPLLDLENFRNRKLPSITNRLRINLGNQPKLSHGFTSQRLNFQPNRKLALIAPNLQHPGSGIPWNHGVTLRRWQELERT